MTRLLGPVRDRRSVDAFLDALESPTPNLRAVAAEVLAQNPDPEVTEALSDRLTRERDKEVIIALVGAVGRRGSPELAADIVTAALRDTKDPELRIAALRALAGVGFEHEAVRKFFERCARVKDWKERMAILAVAAETGDPGAAPLLLEMVDDKAWQVRLTAVQGLGRVRSKEAIPPLIDRLEEEELARIRRAISDTLFRITGVNLYDSVELWRKWWKERGEKFEVPDARPELPPQPPGGGTRAKFYGIPVESDRVIFVIDQSGSMGHFGTDDKPSDLDKAVEQTLAVIEKLDKNARVNVILFETTVRPWAKQLVPLNKKSRAALKRHLLAQKPMGSTNLYDALEMALLTPKVDTVYLLSDGSPTGGKFVDDEDILREVRNINRLRRIAIHCVSLGFPSRLLKQLAEQNGGCFVTR